MLCPSCGFEDPQGMRFCGRCATPLNTRCTQCGFENPPGFAFCGQCATSLGGDSPPPAPPVTIPKLSQTQQQQIEQLRTDLQDPRPFVRETYRVILRLNAVNLMIHQFNETVGQIDNSTSREEFADIIGAAINEVDLSNARELLPQSDEALEEITRSSFVEMRTNFAEALPNYQRWTPDFPDVEEMARHHAARVIAALHKHRGDLEKIEWNYDQLVEFYPRFRFILTRTGVLDVVIGFAVGLFVGPLAEVGASLWDGWQEQSDEQFIKSFGGAGEDFVNTGLRFTQETEQAMQPVIEQMLDDYTEVGQGIISGIERAAHGGEDLDPIYRKLHMSDVPLDEDARAFFEIVFDNLREQGFSGRSERNVRSSIGM